MSIGVVEREDTGTALSPDRVELLEQKRQAPGDRPSSSAPPGGVWAATTIVPPGTSPANSWAKGRKGPHGVKSTFHVPATAGHLVKPLGLRRPGSILRRERDQLDAKGPRSSTVESMSRWYRAGVARGPRWWKVADIGMARSVCLEHAPLGRGTLDVSESALPVGRPRLGPAHPAARGQGSRGRLANMTAPARPRMTPRPTVGMAANDPLGHLAEVRGRRRDRRGRRLGAEELADRGQAAQETSSQTMGVLVVLVGRRPSRTLRPRRDLGWIRRSTKRHAQTARGQGRGPTSLPPAPYVAERVTRLMGRSFPDGSPPSPFSRPTRTRRAYLDQTYSDRARAGGQERGALTAAPRPGVGSAFRCAGEREFREAVFSLVIAWWR